MPKFALRSSRAPLLLRQLRPGDVFQPAVTSNKLCRIPGSGSRSSEDNAALRERERKKKRVSFFSTAYLLRWHGSRNHKSWNITETNLQSRFVRLSEGSFTFKPPTSPSFTLSLQSTEEKLLPLSAPHLTQPTLKTKELVRPLPERTAVFITANCQYLSILGRH